MRGERSNSWVSVSLNKPSETMNAGERHGILSPGRNQVPTMETTEFGGSSRERNKENRKRRIVLGWEIILSRNYLYVHIRCVPRPSSLLASTDFSHLFRVSISSGSVDKRSKRERGGRGGEKPKLTTFNISTRCIPANIGYVTVISLKYNTYLKHLLVKKTRTNYIQKYYYHISPESTGSSGDVLRTFSGSKDVLRTSSEYLRCWARVLHTINVKRI